jgi:two-component system sensor histidine kinase UhpB
LFVEITHADDRASLVAHLGGLVHKGVCDFEFRIHHKNGELRWIEHLCQPVRDAVGKSLGRRASNSDITARKRAKQLLADNAKQLHELSSHLQSVREEERTRVARELHDELGQLLTALKMDVSLLLADTPVSSGAAARLASMTRLADEALGTIHRIAADLRPVMLDDLGLRAAIEWLVEEFGKRYPAITCNLVFDHVGDTIEGEMATAAYRIVQECLTNIIRHAEASKVHIVVAVRERREILIAVQDNGRGLREPITKEGGFGLLGMRERAMALGGSFSVGSIPGEGVSVDVTIPLPDIEYGSAP